MKKLFVVFILLGMLTGCGGLMMNQEPIQPIEAQLLTKIAATQILNARDTNPDALAALHAWTVRGEAILAAVNPDDPNSLHAALLGLSQDPRIPGEYADVAALMMVILTNRVHIDTEALENMPRAVELSHAVLKGLSLAVEQRQNSP